MAVGTRKNVRILHKQSWSLDYLSTNWEWTNDIKRILINFK